jgi:hypothetical protein
MMEQLPGNPYMLASAVNMWLRDGEFDSLEDLCVYFDRNPIELKQELEKIGLVYNEDLKQFK